MVLVPSLTGYESVCRESYSQRLRLDAILNHGNADGERSTVQLTVLVDG